MMWDWTRGGRKQDKERFAALEKAVEGLNRDSKVIRLEWEDVYDRVTRTMGRLNARIRKAEQVAEPEGALETETVPAPLEVPVATGTHAQLVQARSRRGRV